MIPGENPLPSIFSSSSLHHHPPFLLSSPLLIELDRRHHSLGSLRSVSPNWSGLEIASSWSHRNTLTALTGLVCRTRDAQTLVCLFYSEDRDYAWVSKAAMQGCE